MNIVDTVDVESQLQEKGDEEISINDISKNNIEKDNLHNDEITNCITLQNDKTSQGNNNLEKDTKLHSDKDMKDLHNDDTVKSGSKKEDVKDNNLQNEKTLKDCNSQNDEDVKPSNIQDGEPEINNIETNGINHTENENKQDSNKNDDNRKITIVLNSKKGYEIKNDNKYSDTETCVNEGKDDSVDEETTEDSVTDKSDDEDEENQGKGKEEEEDGEKENGRSKDGENGEKKNKVQNKNGKIPEDEQSEDGEMVVDEESEDVEDEDSEKDVEDAEDEGKKLSKDTKKIKMVNGVENIANGIDEDDDDEDDDDEDEEDSEKEEKEGEEINEEITPEFDNKYEGKTTQLPNFAVVYSFLNMFGALMDLPHMSLLDLEQSIDTTKELGGKEEPGILELLHVKLFRKLSKSSRMSGMANCTPDRLHKSILKFCQVMDMDFTRDFQQSGYHILTSEQRLKILKNLCEVQFDENAKFRNDFQELYKADQSVLRLCPFGYEQGGSYVWLHEDTECNVHVYAVDDDDPDGNTWRVRVGCLDDMAMYISKLKLQTEINPKDLAKDKIKERHIAREEERQRKKAERDERRREQEQKRAQKKGRSTRRSRGKKRNQEEETPASPIPISETSEEEEDDGCVQCYENKQADIVLLCDGCDAAYHTLCLRPPVMEIPDDDWFCPFCLQVQLVQKLELKFIELKNKLKKKERKAKRLDFYGIRSDNIVEQPTDGRRLGRAAARRVDYNFTDYDQLISEAVSNYSKKVPVNPRREGDEKGSDENGSNDGGMDRENSRSRRNVTSGVQKRKLTVLSSDDEYEESEGSEYMYSSSEEVRYSNMKNFIVNDNIDEVEERYTRNKRLRRSGRNRNNTRSCRKKRRRYEEDSDYNEDSDKSSDEGRPKGRRLRERKAENLRNVFMYTEQFSDDEDIVVKEVDDGGEWDMKNEGETVGEDLESEELSSNSEPENKVQAPPPPTRPLSVRVKKKRYVLSDGDSDEEVPYADDSEEENNNKIEIDDDTEEEEVEVKEVKVKTHTGGNKIIESDSESDEMTQDDPIEEEEEEEEEELDEETEKKEIDEDVEGRNTEKETDTENKIINQGHPRENETTSPTESVPRQVDDELMRKIKEEEEIAGINLKDDGILKSGILPPCFSSSLPQNDHSPPPCDSPPPLDEISPRDTNIFRSSENQYSHFKADEFWKELNDSNKEVETLQNTRKDNTEKNSSDSIEDTKNVINASVDNLKNKDSSNDKLPKENISRDVLRKENDNLQNFRSHQNQFLRDNSNKQSRPMDSNSSNVQTERLNVDQRSLNREGEDSSRRVPPVTSACPVDKVYNKFNRQSGASAYPVSSNSPDIVNKQSLDASKNTAFHRPLPSNETSESKTPDIKPNISEMESAYRMSAAPSTFYTRPPPPYHPPEYSPRGPSRMPTPAVGRGPLHPQHRLRAMAAALQPPRPQLPGFGPRHAKKDEPTGRYQQSVPRSPRQQLIPPGHRNQQSLSVGPRHMQSATHGHGQQQSATHCHGQQQSATHGPRHQQSPPLGPRQQQSPPLGPRHQQSPPLGPRHQQSPPLGPRHQQSPPLGPRHQQCPPPGHRQKQSPPLGPRPQQPTGRQKTPPPGHRPQQTSSMDPRHQQPSIQLGANNHPAGRLPAPAHSAASLSLPTHPAMRLPAHPSSRLRPPTAVSSSRQQTPSPMRPTPNYPYASSQPGIRAHPPNWHGSRAPYDYYQQFHRPQAVPTSQYYGGQSNWSQNQTSPDWDRLQEMGDSGEDVNSEGKSREGSAGSREPTTAAKAQSKEYREHMKQLKEHAKQEKELKKLQKQREKELKKQKRSYSPQTTPPNNAVGNMAYFKSMVIGGDNSGAETNTNPTSSYPPFKSSRM